MGPFYLMWSRIHNLFFIKKEEEPGSFGSDEQKLGIPAWKIWNMDNIVKGKKLI